MKRASFLKIVSVVMVVAMMLCNTIGVYADTISASQNPADTTINISGNLDGARPYEDSAVVLIFHKDVTAGEQATLMAQLVAGTLPPSAIGTKILGIAQATVDSNGDFECSVTLDDTASNGTGNYSVVAVPSTTATPAQDTLYFVPSVDKIVILKNLITTPVQSDIETNKSVFAFDVNTYWDAMSAYQSTISSNLATNNAILADLRADIGNVTLDDVDTVTLAIAQEIYALALANGVMDPAATASPTPLALLADMDQYANAADYENAYANYASASARATVDAAVIGNPSLSSFAQLFKEYKEQILLNSVIDPKDANGANSRLALDALAATAGLDAESVAKYVAADAANRQSVADACKTSGATTFAALNTAFMSAVATLPESSGGSGLLGGGGGGGGGSVTTVVQPTPTPAQKPIYERYNDINDYEWAWDAIEVLADRNIVAGYENGSFAPANSILREEFIKLAVVGLLGADAINASAVPTFEDAKTGWYAPYIAAAESNNITSGIGNGLFGTGAQITRQDMAVMLYRMLRSASVNGPADAYAFTDAADIADYAAEAVYTLKNMGIINGDPDGSFRPNGQTTRAEAAVLLFKTLNKLGKIIY